MVFEATSSGRSDSHAPGLLGQEVQARRLQPRIDLLEGLRQRCGRREDSRVCRNGQKLVEAGPRNGPRRYAFCELADDLVRLIVP